MTEIEEFLKDWDELSFEYKNLEVYPSKVL